MCLRTRLENTPARSRLLGLGVPTLRCLATRFSPLPRSVLYPVTQPWAQARTGVPVSVEHSPRAGDGLLTDTVRVQQAGECHDGATTGTHRKEGLIQLERVSKGRKRQQACLRNLEIWGLCQAA